jgi:hypothetical protein
MIRLSVAGAFGAIVLANAGCARSEPPRADTTMASSTPIDTAAARVDTVATTIESSKSVSTVTRTAPLKKSSGSVARTTSGNNSVRSINSSSSDSVLGRDSVIRFPIRRLPTASSTPIKR